MKFKYHCCIVIFLMGAVCLFPHICHSYMENTHRIINDKILSKYFVRLDDIIKKGWA